MRISDWSSDVCSSDLIGPNGAGKTTCFNAVTGVYRPTFGDIRFLGRSLVGKKRYQITKLGIARTFQNIRLFPNMTELENVLVGADARHSRSEEHTSELQSLMRISYAVFCLKK